MNFVMTEVEAIPRRNVGPINFSVLPLAEAIDMVTRLASTPLDKGVAVHFCNAYNVALADDDPEYARLINSGDLVFTDGTPVVWAGKRLHKDFSEAWTRVYGPDVFTGVLAPQLDAAARHYFLGSTPETLAALQAAVSRKWPDATIVGIESPPFRAPTGRELAQRDARIEASGATCVWVGLGTPKQDHEVRRLANAMPIVALAIGAAFDFVAETKRQAPKWMQSSGTEWAYRLATEPRRLSHRYLWGNPRFVYSVLRNWSMSSDAE